LDGTTVLFNDDFYVVESEAKSFYIVNVSGWDTVKFIENQFDILIQACRKTKKPLFNFSSWGLIGDLLPDSSV
jgi:hypothetical protein